MLALSRLLSRAVPRCGVLVLLVCAGACDESNAAEPATTPATATRQPEAPSPPAGIEGARQVLAPFLVAGADLPALSQALKPQPEDYAAVFEGEAAAKAKAYYEQQWADGVALLHKPEQTELHLWQATTEQLTNEPKGNVMKSDAKHFPGGYSKVAPHVKKGLTFYAFRIAKPGSDTGMIFDGLVHVNGRWVMFAKPWIALGLEGKDKIEKLMDEGSPAMIGEFLAKQKK